MTPWGQRLPIFMCRENSTGQRYRYHALLSNMAASLSSDLRNGHQQDFEEWLSSRMRELGLDEEVFGSYVKGILDSEDSNEADFKDALIGILEGMTVSLLHVTRLIFNRIDTDGECE